MEKKRKFLFVSLTGLVGDIAWQVLKEGHEVRYFIGDPEEKDIADGFVPKTDDWEKDVDWADVIVFDDTLGQGEKAVALRAKGKAVVGGTPYTDRLEDDRSFGQEELKKAGVTIIPYRDFDNFDEAIAYVQENPTRYVIKPSGAAGNVKRRLFVGDEEDGRDVVRMLEAYKKAFSDEIKVFQLQKRVVGVEVAVGGFFNGKSFVYPINTNFEHKKLFPGNSGPPTGEMGTTMFWSRAQQDLRADAPEDGAAPGRGGLRRLHRRQLHRQQQRDLPARVHVALRLPDDLHPAGRHDHADRPLPRRPRPRPRPEAQGQERLPGRRADRHAALPLRRQRDVRVVHEERRHRLQEGHARGGPHRGHQDRRGPVARRRAPRASSSPSSASARR